MSLPSPPPAAAAALASANVIIIYDQEIAHEISAFLDPQSFYHWSLVWTMAAAGIDVDDDEKLPPDMLLVTKLDHLRRMGATLPSNIAYCNPMDMILLTATTAPQTEEEEEVGGGRSGSTTHC
jgi:hypothetical protein